jgi:hypothetical protein
MLHEGGYTMEAIDGDLRFHRPDGRVIEHAPPLPAAPRLAGEGEMPPPSWDGTPVDYDWAVFGLRGRMEAATGSARRPRS